MCFILDFKSGLFWQQGVRHGIPERTGNMGCTASREQDDEKQMNEMVAPKLTNPPAYDEAPVKTDGICNTLRHLSQQYGIWARTAFTHRSNTDGVEIRAGMQRCVELLTNGRKISPNLHRAIATYVKNVESGELSEGLHAFTE
jgi:hypothetical protein